MCIAWYLMIKEPLTDLLQLHRLTGSLTGRCPPVSQVIHTMKVVRFLTHLNLHLLRYFHLSTPLRHHLLGGLKSSGAVTHIL